MLGSQQFDPLAWQQQLTKWQQLTQQDDLWALLLEDEIEGGFETTAFMTELDDLRRSSAKIAAEAFIENTRDIAINGDHLRLAPCLKVISELINSEEWAVTFQDELINQMIKPLTTKCESITKYLQGSVAHDNLLTAANKTACEVAEKRFKSEVEPDYQSLANLRSASPTFDQRCKEIVAQCLTVLALKETWADTFVKAEDHLKEALALAKGTLTELSIEQHLEGVTPNANQERLVGKAISGAPTLYSINGFGFALYGSTDNDSATASHVSTYYFTALFFPIFPIARYRVRLVGDRTYQFLGKLPLRTFDKLHLAASIGLILYVIVASNMTSTPGTSPPSSFSSGGATSDQSSLPSADTSSPPISSQPTAGSKSALKAQIESGRARITALETELQPSVDRAKSFQNQMDFLKTELDSLDAQKTNGQEIDVAHYNSLVEEFNSLLDQKKTELGSSSTKMQEYDTLLAEDKRMVAEYNARTD